MEKVLVTGGAGFIGSNTVDALIEENYSVSIVDNLCTGNKKNLNQKAAFFEVDITNALTLKKTFEKARPNFVVHEAAQINVRHSVDDPVFDAVSNVIGSINVLQCCKEFEVAKVVYASSGGAVYGEPKYLPADEKHSVNPICPYAVSKHAVEQYLFQYNNNFGLDYTVLRYSNVFGPRQDPRGEAGVVCLFLEKMLKGETPKINGDGNQTRDFVFVGDVAKANILALQKKTKSRIFNIGSGKPTSVNEIFSELKSLTGFKPKPTHGPEILGELRDIYLNTGLAKKELGWKPMISLKKGLEKTVEWTKQKMAP